MNRVRRFGSNLAFVWNKNLWRLFTVLLIFAVLITLNGTVAVVSSAFSFILSAPALAIQLGFALTFGILQFAGIMWFLSRPRKYTIKPDDPQIGMTFENYRGQPDLLEHAKLTVGILRGVKAFEDRGGEMPKGMLLSGLPGTGKTFLAAVIASEANLPFIYIDASSLRGMFWGMTELMIMKLFRDARGLARKYAQPGQRGACIMFMDEIDSIGMNRGGQGNAGGQGMVMGGMMMGGGQGLNTLLNQMDSLTEMVEDRWRYKILRWFGIVRGPVKNKPLVFVIGATNRPSVLDPALIRPGRLDRILEVHRPDAEGRLDIIQHFLASKAHDPEIQLDLLVNDSMGWTPIQIKTIINEALIHAHQNGREFLTYKDWLDAADERALGLKQPIRSWNLTDRRETAYHEAGHAVAAHYLRPEHRISKATIIRRGHALGYVQQRPREERTSLYARSIETQIMVSLAGHVVENRFLDKLSTGPSSDLNYATVAAEDYVGSLAMGPTKIIVPMQPGSPPIGPVLVAANELLDQLYEETERLLREKEPALHYLAKALIERDELIGSELEAVFAEVEAAYPYLRTPFTRQLIQFHPFASPRDGEHDQGSQPPAPSEEEAAAADEPAAAVPGGGELPGTVAGGGSWLGPVAGEAPGIGLGVEPGPEGAWRPPAGAASGVGSWQPPRPTGMPTDVVPPWGRR
jgi:cell division protease FtsH